MTASDDHGGEGKRLLDQALDLLFYAPVGFVASTLEDLGDLGELAEMGRTRIGRLLSNARVIGKMAVGLGRRSVESEVSRWLPPPASERANGETANGETESEAAAEPTRLRRQPEPIQEIPRRITADADLAIPGYETLSASQVVRRLDGLGAAELQAIYEHEAGTRRRRTILHRTQQLLGHEDAPGPASWPA